MAWVDLVSAEWLNRHMAEAGVCVLDATTLMTPQPVGPSQITHGGALWASGHIPGSQHVCMVGDFSDPNGAYPYTLPTATQVADRCQALGIQPDSHVVIYTASQPMVATRVWWVLRTWGLSKVSILDGGLPHWRSCGYPLDTRALSPAPVRRFEPQVQANWVADAEDVMQAMADPDCVLINALSAPQFAGSGGAHYGRPGRIPGSIHVPAAAMFEPESMVWKQPHACRTLFEASGLQPGSDRRAIVYCGGGIAASVVFFVLKQLGHERVALYDNSLLEWSANPECPMALG